MKLWKVYIMLNKLLSTNSLASQTDLTMVKGVEVSLLRLNTLQSKTGCTI